MIWPPQLSTVYIVMGFQYSPDETREWLAGVFSTQAKANLFIASANIKKWKHGGVEYEVIQTQIDPEHALSKYHIT